MWHWYSIHTHIFIYTTLIFSTFLFLFSKLMFSGLTLHSFLINFVLMMDDGYLLKAYSGILLSDANLEKK